VASAAPGDCRLIRGIETPDVATDDVSACRQDVWFHDSGTKVGNLTATGQTAMPTWNTTKPAASATSGAGGGYFLNSVTEIAAGEFGEESGPTFTGTFTGDIDNLALDLYVLDPQRTALGETGSIRSRLEIDGQAVYTDAEALAANATAAGNLRHLRLAYTDLYDAMQGSGVTVGPAQQHTVKLSTLVFYFGDEEAIFYDAAEAPSGLIFNLEDAGLADYATVDVWEEF
jgi:hypothetical protein